MPKRAIIGEEGYKVVFHGHIVDPQASKKLSCVIWYVFNGMYLILCNVCDVHK